MSTAVIEGRDKVLAELKKYVDMDIDELLSQLTEEQIDELNDESDPDNPMLPPCDRVRNQTKKLPTGPLDRKKLLKYLEKQGKEDKDWEEKLPYEAGVKRGMVFEPKESAKLPVSEEDGIELDLPEEYEDALKGASEAELIDIAGVLELHSMLTQDQYWESFKNVLAQEKDATFSGPAKMSQLKIVLPEKPNDTDFGASLEKLKSNDSSMKTLNLNNKSDLSEEQLLSLCEAMKSNTSLQLLSMAYVNAKDIVAEKLCDALEENKTLKVLNLDSNQFTAAKVRDLVKATVKNMTLLELRATNQRSTVLGVKFESEICKLVQENTSILRLGLNFETLEARMKIVEYLQRNTDTLRQNRVNDEAYTPPKFNAPKGTREKLPEKVQNTKFISDRFMTKEEEERSADKNSGPHITARREQKSDSEPESD
ncbi:PREDICTED: tropomodulin-1-like [Priapulus caudatus]|uniref:Tropomodulin-1-like n=1 Tax=Priapulus caudatus TaxID=37621 RepID=A0ABM1E9B5_PRICU|nr:PREDICTED: tropomodulin-1-like [Priapulus caudatus]